MKRHFSWIVVASLLALSGCIFIANSYKEFCRIKPPWPAIAASATPDGRLIALHVDDAHLYKAKVNTYQNGTLLASTDVSSDNHEYVCLDATDQGDAFWLVTTSGLFELWDLNSSQGAHFIGRFDSHGLGIGGYDITAIAAGRGNSLYVSAWTRSLDTGVFSSKILRIRYSQSGSTLTVTGVNTQTKRADTLAPLHVVTHLEVDQSTGQVYALDRQESGDGHLLTYNEDLSRDAGTTARVYGRHISDLEATAGLLATTRYDGGITAFLEIINSVGDTWNVFSTTTEDVHNYFNGNVMAREPVKGYEEHCAYLWTFGEHSASDGFVNLLGRHTVCDDAKYAPPN
jgi:hypothetical protein